MASEADPELWDIDIDQDSAGAAELSWTLDVFHWDPVGLVATRKPVDGAAGMRTTLPHNSNDDSGGYNEGGMEIEPQHEDLFVLDPKTLASAPVYQQQPPGCKLLICQVAGCGMNLDGMKGYFLRHRVCEEHSKAPVLLIGDVPSRLCQQCSKFHHVSAFEGSKRTCRVQLDRIRVNKRIRRNRKLNAAATAAYAATAPWVQEGGAHNADLPAAPAALVSLRGKRPADSSGSGEGSWADSSRKSRHVVGGTTARALAGGGGVAAAAAAAAQRALSGITGDGAAAGGVPAVPATFFAVDQDLLLPDSGGSDTGSREHPRASLGLSGPTRWQSGTTQSSVPPMSPAQAAQAHSPASGCTGSQGAAPESCLGPLQSSFSNFAATQNLLVCRIDSVNNCSLPASCAEAGLPGSIVAAAAAAGLLNQASLTTPLAVSLPAPLVLPTSPDRPAAGSAPVVQGAMRQSSVGMVDPQQQLQQLQKQGAGLRKALEGAPMSATAPAAPAPLHPVLQQQLQQEMRMQHHQQQKEIRMQQHHQQQHQLKVQAAAMQQVAQGQQQQQHPGRIVQLAASEPLLRAAAETEVGGSCVSEVARGGMRRMMQPAPTAGVATATAAASVGPEQPSQAAAARPGDASAALEGHAAANGAGAGTRNRVPSGGGTGRPGEPQPPGASYCSAGGTCGGVQGGIDVSRSVGVGSGGSGHVSAGTNTLSSSKLIRMSLENDDVLDDGTLMGNLMDLLQTQATDPRDIAWMPQRNPNGGAGILGSPGSHGSGNGNLAAAVSGGAGAPTIATSAGDAGAAGGSHSSLLAAATAAGMDIINAAAISRAGSGAVGSPQTAMLVAAAAAGYQGIPSLDPLAGAAGTGLTMGDRAAGLGGGMGPLGGTSAPVAVPLASASSRPSIFDGQLLSQLSYLQQQQALLGAPGGAPCANDLVLQQQLLLVQQAQQHRQQQQQLQYLQHQQQLLQLQQQAHVQSQVTQQQAELLAGAGGAPGGAPGVPAAGLLLSRLLDADTKTHHLSSELNGCLVEKQLLRRQLVATLSSCHGSDPEQVAAAAMAAAATSIGPAGAAAPPGVSLTGMAAHQSGGVALSLRAGALGGLGTTLGTTNGLGAPGLCPSGLPAAGQHLTAVGAFGLGGGAPGGLAGMGLAGAGAHGVGALGGGMGGLGAGLNPGGGLLGGAGAGGRLLGGSLSGGVAFGGAGLGQLGPLGLSAGGAGGLCHNAAGMGAFGGVLGGGTGHPAAGAAGGPGACLLTGASRPSAAAQLHALAEARAAVVSGGAGTAAVAAQQLGGSAVGAAATAAAAGTYGGPDLLTRVSLKIMNCLPDELPNDIRSRMQLFASQAPLDLVQGCLRPGCTEVVLDALHTGRQQDLLLQLLRSGDADAAAAALFAALPESLHTKEIYLQAADQALCLRPGAPPRRACWASMAIRRGGLKVPKPELLAAESLVLPVGGPADAEGYVRFRVYGRHLTDPGVTLLARLAGLALQVTITQISSGSETPAAAAAATTIITTTAGGVTDIPVDAPPTSPSQPPFAPDTPTLSPLPSPSAVGGQPTTAAPYETYSVEVQLPYNAPPQGLLILEPRAGVLLGAWAPVVLLDDAALAAEAAALLAEMDPEHARRLAVSLGLFVDHAERCAAFADAEMEAEAEAAAEAGAAEDGREVGSGGGRQLDFAGESGDVGGEPRQRESSTPLSFGAETEAGVDRAEASSRMDAPPRSGARWSEVFGPACDRVVDMGRTLLAYCGLRGCPQLLSYVGAQLMEMGESLASLVTRCGYNGCDLLACAALSGCVPALCIVAEWTARAGVTVDWRAQVPGHPPGASLLHLAVGSLPLPTAVNVLELLWALATSPVGEQPAHGDAFAAAWFADDGGDFDAPSLLLRVAAAAALPLPYTPAAAVAGAAGLTALTLADELDQQCLLRLASSYIRSHNYTSPLDNVDLPSTEANSCALLPSAGSGSGAGGLPARLGTAGAVLDASNGAEGCASHSTTCMDEAAGQGRSSTHSNLALGDIGVNAVPPGGAGRVAAADAVAAVEDDDDLFRAQDLEAPGCDYLRSRTRSALLLTAAEDRSGHGSNNYPPVAVAATSPPSAAMTMLLHHQQLSTASPGRIRVAVAPKAIAQTAAAAAAAAAVAGGGRSSWFGSGSGADASLVPPSGATNGTNTTFLYGSGSLPAFGSTATVYENSTVASYSQLLAAGVPGAAAAAAVAAAAGGGAKKPLPADPLLNLARPLPGSPSTPGDASTPATSRLLCDRASGAGGSASLARQSGTAADPVSGTGMIEAIEAVREGGSSRGGGGEADPVMPWLPAGSGSGRIPGPVARAQGQSLDGSFACVAGEQAAEAAAEAGAVGVDSLGHDSRRGHMRGLARMFKRLFKKGGGTDAVAQRPDE